MKKDKEQIKMMQIACWNAIMCADPKRKEYWIKRYFQALRLAKTSRGYIRGYYRPKKSSAAPINKIINGG